MKTSSVVKIVCWSLVAVILTGVLTFTIGMNDGWNIPMFRSNYIGNNTDDSYVSNQSTADANVVNKINIDWLSGEIKIVKGEGDTIRFTESSSSELNDRTALVSKVEGNELKIGFTRDGRGVRLKNLSKDLTVTVPKDLLNLDIETVSGETSVSNITVNEFDIEKVSGRLVTDNLVANKVDFESVSGSTDLKGSFNSINGNTVSGSVDIESLVCPSRIDIESVSGSTEILIPENDGFTARSDRMSGGIKTDFESQYSGKTIVYKNGGASFGFEGVSGSVTINRAV